MPITRPAVTYWHERGSRDGTSFRSTFGPDETVSTGRFFVDWGERHNAVMSLLGYSQLEGAITDPTRLMRLTPHQHPDIASAVGGVGNLYATRISSVTGYKSTGSRTSTDPNWQGAYFNQFEKAELEVEFSQTPYLVLEDADLSDTFAEYERFTSIESFQPSADYLMLPGGTMVYLRDTGTATPHNRAIPFNVGVILPTVELKIKWWAVPFDICAPLTDGPWKKRIFGDGTSVPYLGTVNKSAFLGFPAGTLLFSNVELQMRRFPYTGLGWDVIFTLAYDPRKWNFKMFVSTNSSDASAFGWYFVAKSGASYAAPGSLPDYTSIYNERELKDLWKVAA